MSSTPVTDARTAALRIRREVERGLRLDVAFGRVAPELTPDDRRFAQELAYGTTRLRGRLDHLLGLRVERGLERLDPVVHEVLRLGAYQLLRMDAVPDYAAISQSVELARGAGRGAASGLVNAVLRAVARHGEDRALFPDPSVDPVGYLKTWGSHPEWLLRRWLERWAADEVGALVDADNTPPERILFPLGEAPDAARRRLGEAGIGAEPAGARAPGLRLTKGSDPAAALDTVPEAVIQDPAAHLVARSADFRAGTKVADLCAAPGGKALVLAERALYTLAADRSELRMRMMRDNVRRVGRRVGLVVADALHPPFRAAGGVLLDAPCTGTGTLRRHPDGRWRLRPSDLARLAEVQRELLDSAARVVEPGGLLVYATCSLEPEENALQVDAFLERRSDFRLEPVTAVEAEYVDERGCLEVLPQRHGYDGAFAARLRRAA